MNYRKIHITGASGSGTTTLANRMSKEFGLAHYDTDDIFWEKTDPPYQIIKEEAVRKNLLKNIIVNNDKWVISGSLCGWGDFAIPEFNLVIFLWVPTDIRISRLKQRETNNFGKESLSPGGAMYENHIDFIDWASCYDNGDLDMRSKAMHELWLKNLPCKVLRYEGDNSTEYIIKDLKELKGGDL